MRLDDIEVHLAFTIPFGHPDKNGTMYSKEAIEKAIDDFNKTLPILYRDSYSCKEGVVIGNTDEESCVVLWHDDQKTCDIIVRGNIYYGGADIFVNDVKDGVVTDFRTASIGLSR